MKHRAVSLSFLLIVATELKTARGYMKPPLLHVPTWTRPVDESMLARDIEITEPTTVQRDIAAPHITCRN